MILDIEGDFVVDGTSRRKSDQYYWHKEKLRKDGVSKEELRRREEQQKEWDSAKKKKRRAVSLARRCEEGLLHSSVMAFSLACVEDAGSTYTCTVHVMDIVTDGFNGRPGMPEALWQLFSLDNVVWTNCGISGDIAALHHSFGSDRIVSAKHVDTVDL